MKLFRNKYQCFVYVLLLALCWANVNIFTFSHVHHDENGRIYVHAHPYHKQNQQGQTTPGHTHTKSESLLLGLIYKVFTSFIIAFFLYTLLYPNTPAVTQLVTSQWHPVCFSGKSIKRRGPPSLSSFVIFSR